MEEWHVIWRATVICHGPLLCILGALVISVQSQASLRLPASLPAFLVRMYLVTSQSTPSLSVVSLLPWRQAQMGMAVSLENQCNE